MRRFAALRWLLFALCGTLCSNPTAVLAYSAYPGAADGCVASWCPRSRTSTIAEVQRSLRVARTGRCATRL